MPTEINASVIDAEFRFDRDRLLPALHRQQYAGNDKLRLRDKQQYDQLQFDILSLVSPKACGAWIYSQHDGET
jgi:hypothetical protein